MCGRTPPPPDYRPVADASAEAARIAADQANRQLDFAQRQYDENAPLAREISRQQMEIMQRTSDQGQQYFDHWRDNFQGLERQLVADAQAYDTEANRNRLATQAAADAGLAFQQTNAASERAMRSMGVNPNSGRFNRAQRGNALALAATRAGAMNNTRTQAEALGYARRLDASGLGRGMPGASAGAYGVATGAGSSALGSQLASGNQMLGAMQGAAGTMMAGQNARLGGLGSILGSQSNLYATGMNNSAQMMSAGLGMLGGFAMGSDRRMKENIVKVGTKGPINIYRFNYKGDDKVYEGVMSDEIRKLVPDAVTVDELSGFDRVDYSMIGVEFKEVTA